MYVCMYVCMYENMYDLYMYIYICIYKPDTPDNPQTAGFSFARIACALASLVKSRPKRGKDLRLRFRVHPKGPSTQ